MKIEYHDDAWDYFDNHGGRDRFDLPQSVDIYNDVDYCLIIDGHDNHFKNPHMGDLYIGKYSHWIANMVDKINGNPYTVVITWHG